MKKAYNRALLLFVAFFLYALAIVARAPGEVDSLEAIILHQVNATSSPDTSTIKLINGLSHRLLKGDLEKAQSYALQGIELAKKIAYAKGEAVAHQRLGDVHKAKNEFDQAIESYTISADLFERCKLFTSQGYVLGEIGGIYKNLGSFESALKYHFSSAKAKERDDDYGGLGYTYDLIGIIYSDQKMFDQALQYHNKAVEIKKQIDNKKGLAFTLDQIGRIYRHKQLYDTALTYHLLASEIKKEIGNDMGLAYTYDQIGRTYRAQEDYDRALEFHEKASVIKERIGNKKGLAYTFDHIGKIYLDLEKHELAIAYQTKAAEIKKDIGNLNGLAISLLNIGHSYVVNNKYYKGIQYLEEALKYAKALKSKTITKDIYLEFSKCYEAMRDFELSLIYYNRYSNIKDSIISEESIRQIADMQTKYNTEKKERELQISELELTNNRAELRTSNLIVASLAFGLVLIVALSAFVYKNFRQKKKANLLLETKNLAITKQSSIIESRNKKITDSIDYAKRIQEALLANRSKLSEYFKDSFILYKPKDIVSGDFFWIKQMNGTILFAVADCTGHGVPGAFMSIVCNNVLNVVTNDLSTVSPAKILEATNDELINRLQKKQTPDPQNPRPSNLDVKDGMDIALCSVDLKNRVLHYAGAHNPIYLIRNDKLIETKGNKLFIGNNVGVTFTDHTIPLEAGDCLYLFSDGFADQKGGPNNKKFYYQPFQELLVSIQQKGMEEQEEHLHEVIVNWVDGKEQIDDIIVLGVKV
ncbi:MAG: tetratricopeptide repeat protein [Flavobacteriales bacterium]|nr:tetratricopeptide repeat protein [Flavobacteriales bacterium]